MAVSYTISDRGCFVELVGTGPLTGEELVQQKLALANDPAVMPGYAELCDLSAVSSLELAPDFFDKIEHATAENQRVHRNSRTAIVVSRADFFDLARRYERTVARLGMTVIVFNHRDTALLWLGRRFSERGRDAGVQPDGARCTPESRSTPDKSGSTAPRGAGGGKPTGELPADGGSGQWGRY